MFPPRGPRPGGATPGLPPALPRNLRQIRQSVGTPHPVPVDAGPSSITCPVCNTTYTKEPDADDAGAGPGGPGGPLDAGQPLNTTGGGPV